LGIGMMMMMCILSSPFPSVPPRIVTTLLYQVYTIKWVILLIVLYDGTMLELLPCHWQWYRYHYCMAAGCDELCIRMIIISSVPTRIITTLLLFQAYTINWVILLIVKYDGIMLVRMTWYTDVSVMTIHDDVMSLSVL